MTPAAIYSYKPAPTLPPPLTSSIQPKAPAFFPASVAAHPYTAAYDEHLTSYYQQETPNIIDALMLSSAGTRTHDVQGRPHDLSKLESSFSFH